MIDLPALPPYVEGRFSPIVDHPGPFAVLDLGGPYDSQQIESIGWAIGKYDEVRTREMYCSDIYDDGRTVHMGLDIWGPAGTEVFAFADGVVYGTADNANHRDYGPTIVTQHDIEGVTVWALHGHLDRESLSKLSTGQRIRSGQVIGRFGSADVNGGWAPHLHLQLSVVDPGKPDMPGVVNPDERHRARRVYPDPRMIVGPVY
jgi:peptidoglycan LD-endopeptidase LytH